MTQCSIRSTDFDLPDNLFQMLLTEIAEQKFKGSFSKYTANGFKDDHWIIKLLGKITFKGYLKTYQLSDQSELEIYKHYKKFIDFVGRPYKIRFKTVGNTRWIPPHSDVENSHRGTSNPNGDSCSIFVGIITNQEITNWYSYPKPFKLDYTFNPFLLKKQKSICLQNQAAVLFDNKTVHSVTNCDVKKERWALAISWQGLEYSELVKLYQEFTKNDYSN